MNPLIESLVAEAPALIDGAWGTQLQARGVAIGECPDLWNLTHPDAVEEVARSYVDAGSQIILTNTFGANPIGLARHDAADKVYTVNRAGAEISKRAAADRARVFASMGPTGKLLSAGELDEGAVRAGFEEQARGLADGGADGIVVETMMDLQEAAIAVACAKATGLPVVACMVYDAGVHHDRTMMGDTPETAAKTLADAGADVVGANCGRGVEGLLPICVRLRGAVDLPVWIKPNAGLPEQVEGQTVYIYRTTPDEFASQAVNLKAAGASFIGGCCGTGPAFIRALAAALGRG